MTTQRSAWVFAGFSGAMAVMMGAAAAHWLQHSLDAAGIARIEKASAYQMYHSLALLAVAVMYGQQPGRALRWAGGLFAAGILCFSGSLYLYSFLPWHPLVFITPLGGVAWIAGWICLALSGLCCSASKNAGQ